MKISIFGLGYVGSVSAACLANKGHHVIGVDSNRTKVDIINMGKSPIIESGLKELTANAVKNGLLTATDDVSHAILNSDISFICVGTPSKKNNGLDLQYVKRICEDIGRVLKEKNEYHIIVCRSTMFPGSIRNVVIPALEKYSDKCESIDFSVCINPEFMKEGTAIHDYYNPPKNVVGTTDQRVRDVMSDLNLQCTGMPTIFLEIEETEILKYTNNIWHALKVGFANEIGNVCKSLDIDSHQVMDVFCKDTKLNLSPYYLKPGFAFGGSCLPKDLRAFLYESQSLNLHLPIISSVLPSNRSQIDMAINMVMEQENKRIGVLGFCFKENTDDLRESPIVELIERLIGKGYDLTLFDKNVSEAKLFGANRDYILNHIPHISQLMVESIKELLDRSETIIIGNKASEFEDVLDNIRQDQVIIDLVRIRNTPPISKQYLGICW
ncbi:MAG: nucleotide sugar dehydrogenase [Legionellaceae bacterium]|nr:nucleotide sugar dehydrogenase [Legionellaceae bacterium]